MNNRKLSMIALLVLLVGICVLSLPVRVSASNTWIQNFFSGPVLVTNGAEFHICATNAAVLSQGPNGAVKVLIGLLSADRSRILFVREAALNPPGQGQGLTGVCLVVTPQELALAGAGPHVIAFAGNGLSGVLQGPLIEAAGGIPGGGCITASLQIRDVNGNANGDVNGVRYIPMEQHQH